MEPGWLKEFCRLRLISRVLCEWLVTCELCVSEGWDCRRRVCRGLFELVVVVDAGDVGIWNVFGEKTPLQVEWRG